MDQHVLWFRRHLIARLQRRAVAVLAASASGIAVLGVVLTSWSTAMVVVAAVLGSCASVVVVFGSNYLLGPLNAAYLRAYLDDAARWVVAPPPDGPAAKNDALTESLVEPLAGAGFRSAGRAARSNHNGPVFAVFAGRDHCSALAISETTGACTVATKLCDGRILMTSDMITIPAERLVVQTVPPSSPILQIAAHRHALARLVDHELHPAVCDASVVLDAFVIEARAYAELGPLLAGLTNLTVDHARWPAVRIDPDEMYERTIGWGRQCGCDSAGATYTLATATL